MTDIVEASTDRVASALATNAGRHAGINDYVVSESDSPFFDPPINSALKTSTLKGFRQVSASNAGSSDWELTVEGGEAFIAGAYVARDTQTVITGDFTSGSRTIGVGWTGTGNGGVTTDAVVIKPTDEFGPNSQYLPLGQLQAFGGGVTYEDLRQTTPQVAVSDTRLDLGVDRIDYSETGLLQFADGNSVVFQLAQGSIGITKNTVVNGEFVAREDTALGTTTIDDILTLTGRTSDPSNPTDGMVWYRSDTDEFRVQEGGSTKTLDTSSI